LVTQDNLALLKRELNPSNKGIPFKSNNIALIPNEYI